MLKAKFGLRIRIGGNVQTVLHGLIMGLGKDMLFIWQQESWSVQKLSRIENLHDVWTRITHELLCMTHSPQDLIST